MDTSDAFTVACSEPPQYFPVPSLVWTTAFGHYLSSPFLLYLFIMHTQSPSCPVRSSKIPHIEVEGSYPRLLYPVGFLVRYLLLHAAPLRRARPSSLPHISYYLFFWLLNKKTCQHSSHHSLPLFDEGRLKLFYPFCIRSSIELIKAIHSSFINQKYHKVAFSCYKCFVLVVHNSPVTAFVAYVCISL